MWTCEHYELRSHKALLVFNSAHSKLVQNGIASFCLLATLQKACPYLMRESFLKQVIHLLEAGFCPNFIACVAKRVLNKISYDGVSSRQEFSTIQFIFCLYFVFFFHTCAVHESWDLVLGSPEFGMVEACMQFQSWRELYPILLQPAKSFSWNQWTGVWMHQ